MKKYNIVHIPTGLVWCGEWREQTKGQLWSDFLTWYQGYNKNIHKYNLENGIIVFRFSQGDLNNPIATNTTTIEFEIVEERDE